MGKTGITFAARKDLAALKEKLQRISDSARAGRKKAIRILADQSGVELASNQRIITKLNKQDSPTDVASIVSRPPGTKIVRDQLDGTFSSSFLIRVGAQYSQVRARYGKRTEAFGFVERFGTPAATLERVSLIIKGRGWKQPRKVDIATFQNLAAWARRPEKGFQLYRHQALIDTAAVLRPMILEPTIERVRPYANILLQEILRTSLKA